MEKISTLHIIIFNINVITFLKYTTHVHDLNRKYSWKNSYVRSTVPQGHTEMPNGFFQKMPEKDPNIFIKTELVLN